MRFNQWNFLIPFNMWVGLRRDCRRTEREFSKSYHDRNFIRSRVGIFSNFNFHCFFVFSFFCLANVNLKFISFWDPSCSVRRIVEIVDSFSGFREFISCWLVRHSFSNFPPAVNTGWELQPAGLISVDLTFDVSDQLKCPQGGIQPLQTWITKSPWWIRCDISWRVRLRDCSRNSWLWTTFRAGWSC